MSGIAALYNVDGAPADPARLAGMGEALSHRGPDAAGVWHEGPVGLVHRMLWTTPESRTERLPLATVDGLVIIADARLDNRDEIGVKLGLTRTAVRTMSDSALIAAAYHRWQEACPEKLLGDFAFCIWDSRRRTVFCARDHMGVKPFYYHHSPRRVVVASEIGAIFHAGDVPKRLNEDRVIDYLLPMLEDKVATFYQDIVRLPPAHTLTVSPDGIRLRQYWSLHPEREIRYPDEEDYADELREIFFEAVRCRLRSAFPVGSLLSGGLDSSSIVCTARELLARDGSGPLQTFSAIFPNTPECDERPYIDAVIAGNGVQPHFVAGDGSSPLADFRESLEHDDEPYYAPNMFLHRALYRAARGSGVRVLLDGIDGDHAISHGIARITELTRALRFFAVAREARAVAKTLNRPVWQVIRARAVAPTLPSSVRDAWRVVVGRRREQRKNSVLHERMARHAAARRDRFSPAAPPLSARQEHFRGLSSGIVPFALEVADRAAARHDLEPRYPFFDKRLLELCLALPSDQKLRSGWTRYVMRRAMHGVLPESVQWRLGKSDLSANFVATLLMEGVDDPAGLRALARYVDASSVVRIHRRTLSERRDHDAVALWRVATLDAWLDGNAFDSEVPLERSPHEPERRSKEPLRA